MAAEEGTSNNSDSCIVCGYCKDVHGPSVYNSGVKISDLFVYEGDWRLGPQHFLKDQKIDAATAVPATHAMLQEATSIPIPRILAFWEEPGARCITIEERAQGDNLAKAWPRLSEAERDDIAQQTADLLKQLRGIQSNRLEGVNGTPVYNAWMFKKFREPSGPFQTKEEFWEALAAPLRKKGVPDKAIEALGKCMPSPEPYTFTHGSIHISHIIIKDMKVVGINEWTRSAYLPCWYEYAMAGVHGDADSERADAEWKDILRPKLGEYSDEAGWFYKVMSLSRYPHLGEFGKQVLEELVDEVDTLGIKVGRVAI